MIIYYPKMENLISLEMIEQNQDMLVGRIFTQLQLKILKKKIKKKALDSNEKTYYYKYIKPKIKAMLSFAGMSEINIIGKEHMIQERIYQVVNMLALISRKHKNKKIMASGSFLFNKAYNDIDFFIFSKYNKEDYRKGSIHVNFLPESALDSMFFSSLSQISISNFRYTPKKEFVIRLEDALQAYEVLIDAILKKIEYVQELRKFFLIIEYLSKGVILNSQQMYELRKKVTSKNAVKLLSDTLVNALLYGYTKEKIQSDLKRYIGDYHGLLRQYRHSKNLEVYIQTYKEAIQVAA